jgi:hypothetical protein
VPTSFEEVTMRFLFILAVAAVVPATVPAAPGAIDWQKRVATCSGSGAPNVKDAGGNVAVARIGAEKAARLDALRNCLEVIKGVTVSGNQTVSTAIGADNSVKGSVEGAVRGFRTVATRYFSDSGVEIDVEVPLDAVADAVLPKAAAAAPASSGPTSLVIDASGLKVAPALAPRLLDEAGKELYGPSALGESARKAGGVAAYARSLDAAKRDLGARLGDRPVVVKALRAEGTDLVLAAADAATFASRPPFLAEGRVVIITD